MPIYLGEEVSDDYMQGLIGAYREGYEDAGGQNVEDGDQVIIDRLAAEETKTKVKAGQLGAQQAKSEV